MNTRLCNQYKQYCTTDYNMLNDFIRFFFFIISFIPFSVLLSTWVVAKFIWEPYRNKLNSYTEQQINNIVEYKHKYLLIEDDETEYETLLSPDTLKNMINNVIKECTPSGNVIMRYNNIYESFEWWSDNKNISYDFLQTVSRKYVLEFNCKPLYIDRQQIIDNIFNNDDDNADNEDNGDNEDNEDNGDNEDNEDNGDNDDNDVNNTYKKYIFNDTLYIPVEIKDGIANTLNISLPDNKTFIKNGFSYIHKLDDDIKVKKHFDNIDELINEYNDFKDNYPINDDIYFCENIMFETNKEDIFVDNKPKNRIKKRIPSNVTYETNKYKYMGKIYKYKLDIDEEHRKKNADNTESKKKMSFADFKKLNNEIDDMDKIDKNKDV